MKNDAHFAVQQRAKSGNWITLFHANRSNAQEVVAKMRNLGAQARYQWDADSLKADKEARSA